MHLSTYGVCRNEGSSDGDGRGTRRRGLLGDGPTPRPLDSAPSRAYDGDDDDDDAGFFYGDENETNYEEQEEEDVDGGVGDGKTEERAHADGGKITRAKLSRLQLAMRRFVHRP